MLKNSSDNSTGENLPSSFQTKFEQLKSQIKRYVLIEGIAKVLFLLGCLFWASLIIDWLYFKSQMLEIPLWVRQVFLFGAIIGIAGGILTWIVARVYRNYRPRGLAMLLEKQFPELDDRLITTVEFGESGVESESTLTQTMLSKTNRDVSQLIQKLDLRSVFDQGPLRRAVMLALVFVISITALAVINNQALARWANGYLLLKDEYWNRKTEISLHVLAELRNEEVDFVDHVHKHPRGEALTLVAHVHQEENAPEVKDVLLITRSADGVRKSEKMFQMSDGLYRKNLDPIHQDMQIWIRGGDYINRKAYQIQVVEPPRLDQFSLFCEYPEYTHLNKLNEKRGPYDPPGTLSQFQSESKSLPVGTRFVLRCQANKPLRSVRLKTDRFEISIKRDESQGTVASLVLKNEDGTIISFKRDGKSLQSTLLPSLPDGRGFSEDHTSFDVDFEMAPDFEAAFKSLASAPQWPIPLGDETKFRVYLNDEDGVELSEPIRLALVSKPDVPPRVQIRKHGIGNKITTKATIPISGEITDDYGLQSINFLYGVNNPKPDTSSPFSKSPKGLVRYPFGNKPEEDREVNVVKPKNPVEKFNVGRLDLAIGNQLSLTVVATDENSVTGNQTGQGEVMIFSIVSDEELKSILYHKEINLRHSLEQIINELEKLNLDLETHRKRYTESLSLKEGNRPVPKESPQLDWEKTRLAMDSCVQRAENSIRQRKEESSLIEDDFRAIREEMMNNGISTAQKLGKIDGLILAPLHKINEVNFKSAVVSVDFLKSVQSQGENPSDAIDNSHAEVTDIIDELREILKAVQEQENLKKLIELIKKTKTEQVKILEKTRQENLKKLGGFSE